MPLRKHIANMVARRAIDEGALRQRRERAEARRRKQGAPHRAMLFHRPDDPYSHLLLQAVDGLLAQYDVELELCAVPAPAEAAAPEPEMLARWSLRDAAELAAYHALDLPAQPQTPEPALVARAEAILAAAGGSAPLSDVQTLYRAVWYGNGQALDTIAQRLGAANREATRAHVAANGERLARLGHYLPATLYYGGEWYWGIDRLPYLAERLAALGANRADPPRPLLPTAAGAGRPLGLALSAGAPAPLEVFYSLRSPYSYLALDRLERLARDFPVELRIRPVLPMVMRGLPVPMAKRLYILRDAKREADRHGVPFERVSDPLGPGIERCMAILAYARREGRAVAFLRQVGRAAWAEGRDIARTRVQRALVERAGLEWEPARAATADDGWREEADANRAAMAEMGLWGVPAFRCGDVALWGQDRLWMLEDKLAAAAGGRNAAE